MDIHSDFLEDEDLRIAARTAGIGFTRFRPHGSRSRAQAWDVILTGHSGRQQGFGGPDEAASWDEVGVFLGVLFFLDQSAHVRGMRDYLSAEHFHWVTGGDYTWPTPHGPRHVRHKWSMGYPSATGTYSTAECQCGAIQRWMIYGHDFAEIASA